MQKRLPYYLLLCFLLLTASIKAQSLTYKFNNNFSERCGLAVPITPGCNDYFYSDTLPAVGSIIRNVYHFENNCGLIYDNAASGNVMGEQYTIEMYFKLDNSTNYCKILDFKDQTVDYGLYVTDNLVQFYNFISGNTTAFASGQYAHLVLARDSATQLAKVYVNGQPAIEFVDSLQQAVLDGANLLHLFRDDINFCCETSPGSLALFRLYDVSLDSAQVLDAYNTLDQVLMPHAFSINQDRQCFSGNDFTLNNLSPDTLTSSFKWYFGDGDSASTVHAQHSYITDGIYDIWMLSDDNGCRDTTAGTVSVFADPFPDLGFDPLLCNSLPVVLDPGPFTTYSWSDGSSQQTLMINQPGPYWVSVIDSNGCTGSDTVVAMVTPVINIGPDSIFCGSINTVLDAGPGQAAYLWSNGTTQQTLAVFDSGFYMVTVTAFSGCVNTDTVYLGIVDLPYLELGNDTVFCEGNTLLLDAGPFYNYQWQDGSNNQTYTVTSSGTYSVLITDLGGCSSFDSIQVVVNPLPVVNLGNDSAFCGSLSLILDAGSGYVTYNWSDGSVLSTLQVSDSGSYAVIVADSNGCISGDTIALAINSLPQVSLGNDTAFCEGTPFILSPDTLFSGFLWNDGSTLSTLDVTDSGTYSVIVTDTNGCQAVDSVYVMMYAAPQVSLGPDTSFCSNTSFILDAGSGFSSYLWNDGSSASSLAVVDSGSYSVTVTGTGGCMASDSVFVGLLQAPLVDLGLDSSFCSGNPYVLDAGAGFSSYLWNDGSTSSSLAVVDSGSYSVLVTAANGCQASDSVNLVMLAAPVIDLGTDTAFCANGVLLLDAGSGFNSYQWNNGLTSQTVNADTTGIYSVTVTNAAGCIGSDSISVTVNPLPPTPNITYTIGNPLISDAPTGNQWYDLNGPIAGATNSFYTPSQSGTYYVVVTDVNGCISAPSNSIVYGLGISSVNEQHFEIYPNPVHDRLIVKFQDHTGQPVIRICDLQGREVRSTTVDLAAVNGKVELDVSTLQPGVYLLQLVSPGHVSNARFIRQ